MKKLFFVIAMLLCIPISSHAASSASDSVLVDKDNLRVIRVLWTAHTDGTFTNYEITNAPLGAIWMVATDPGSTAPTDNYDIDLLDSTGVDIMGAELDDRDTANTEQAMPLIGSSSGVRPVNGKLTLAISNNSVNSATGTIYIYIYQQK